MGLFPIEINKAPYEMLLRVPGIGVNSAKRIITARKTTALDYPDLKKLGVVLKRAQYFILCKGKLMDGLKVTEAAVMRQLMSASTVKQLESQGLYLPNDYEQLSFFDSEKHQPTMEDFQKCLTGQI